MVKGACGVLSVSAALQEWHLKFKSEDFMWTKVVLLVAVIVIVVVGFFNMEYLGHWLPAHEETLTGDAIMNECARYNADADHLYTQHKKVEAFLRKVHKQFPHLEDIDAAPVGFNDAQGYFPLTLQKPLRICIHDLKRNMHQ